jgi:hypothetical protein
VDLLIAEIDEVGKALATLLKPGSSLDRTRKAEVRALLREGFLATQEERSVEALTGTLGRLRRLRDDLLGVEEAPLAGRVSRHRHFGAFDDHLLQIGTFKTAGERNADELADSIQHRLDRILDTVTAEAAAAAEERGNPRDIQLNPEAKELITKRV